MHTHSIDEFRHAHVFLGAKHERNERRTWGVIAICAAMMVAEIAGGLTFGSVALIADGLHMSTHAGALLIAALAYTYARRHASNPRFAFGSGKLGDLAAFSSAIVLAMIALLIGYESFARLIAPVPIAFNEAIPIAVAGLAVNLISAWLLRDDHDHHDEHGHHAHHDHLGHEHRPAHDHDHHDHAHDHDHAHPTKVHRDHNLRAAFVHVIADAAVSVLVIVGLLFGREFGWLWVDAVMGLVATVVILSWSWTLIRSAGAVLIDAMADPALARAITGRLEQGSDRISDLHLWRLGPGHLAAVISLVTHNPRAPDYYKRRLAGLSSLSHVTVEVLTCHGEAH
jgi:cation diffusion facilitator family transporter